MYVMRDGQGRYFARLTQFGPECAGMLPVGHWRAAVVGWHRGEVPGAIEPTAREAWQRLARELGVDLVPHDEATAAALRGAWACADCGALGAPADDCLCAECLVKRLRAGGLGAPE